MPLLENPIDFPRWATVPGADGLSGQPNVVEPPGAKKDTGWHYREKPPRNWENWKSLKTHEWLEFTDEQKRELGSDFAPNSFDSLPTVTSGPGLFVNVATAVDRWLNGEKALQAAASAIAVPASSTSYLYIDTDGIYKTTTALPTAASPLKLLLARVVTSGAAVTELKRIGQASSRSRLSVTVGHAGDADFTSLQEAIDHAGVLQLFSGTASVEVVIVGTLVVAAPVDVKFPIHVRGLSPAGLLSWSFVSGGLFQLQTGAQFSVFENVQLNYTGGAPATTHAAILGVGTGLDGVRVENCLLTSRCGLRMDAGAIGSRWLVRGNRLTQSASDTQGGVLVDPSATAGDWMIADNDLVGPAFGSATPVGVHLVNAVRALIANNRIEGYGDGVRLTTSQDSLVNDNLIRSAANRGINIASQDCAVSGNYVQNCGATASDGSISVTGIRCAIRGNHVFDWQSGFAISALAQENQIQGNACKAGGSAGSPVIRGGIQCQGVFCMVSDNSIDLLYGAGGGAGKPAVYGIKMGAYSGPPIAFTTNSASGSVICGNSIQNLGNTADGGIGIDAGGVSIVEGNFFSNVFGIGIRVDAPATAVRGNTFFAHGYGPLPGIYASGSSYLAFTAAADNCIVTGNLARSPASALVAPMTFETGCVGCFVRQNKMQSTLQYPFNLHLQDYGTWEQSGQTVGAVTANLTPGLGFPPSSTFTIRTLIRAEDAASTDSMAWMLIHTLTTDATGAAVTLVSSALTVADGNAGVDPVPTFTIGGGLYVVQGTGLIGETWNWHARIETDAQLDNYFTL